MSKTIEVIDPESQSLQVAASSESTTKLNSVINLESMENTFTLAPETQENAILCPFVGLYAHAAS